MPIQRCKTNGKIGYRWGASGKCYVGFGARAKAEKQAAAIYASGYTGNVYCATGPGGGKDPTCSPSQAAGKGERARVPIDELEFPGGLGDEVTPLYDNRKMPIIVQDTDTGWKIIDGWGRASGMKNAGKEEIHVIIATEGDIAERRGAGDDADWVRDMYARYASNLDPPISTNAFCPTGPGGGVDPTCSPAGGGYSSQRLHFRRQVSPTEFAAARESSNYPSFLGHQTPEELSGASLILSGDGKVGAAVTRDGDLVNVFNNGGPKGAAAEVVLQAVKHGAKTLDCFDGYLPTYYSQFGFTEVGRMSFSREYAPQGWNYEKYGEPDVVFMALTKKEADDAVRARILKPRADWREPEETAVRYRPGEWDEAKDESRRVARVSSRREAQRVGVGNQIRRVVSRSSAFSRRYLTSNGKRKPNPLRVDPSRTATIRRKFEAEIARRFNQLRKSVKVLLLEEDAFGLMDSTKNVSRLVTNDRFRFLSTPEQVLAFQRWLSQQTQFYILGMTKESIERAWWQQYIEEGYKKGAGRAFQDTRKFAKSTEMLGWYQGTQEDFLRSSFGRPVAIEKVKLLAGRTFTDLKGVTEQMSTVMSRTLTDGLVQGKNPRDIAKTLDENVEGIGKNRAMVIARTEIVRANAEGALDSMEQLGVEDVGVMVEWSTAGDLRVCKECQPLEGIVLKLDEMRGMIPRHPQCRCTPVPAQVGEKGQTKVDWQKEDIKQIKGQRGIEKSIEKSLEAEGKGQKTAWIGADKDISKERPKAIVNVFCPTGEGGGVDPTCSPRETSTTKGEKLYGMIRRGKTWKTLDGKDVPEHIRKLGVPPAWKDAYFNPDPKGDLLARGTDAKDRVQMKYGATHNAKAAAAKFGRVRELRAKRAEIFREIERDSKIPVLKENADALKVVIQTGIRPGSTQDTGADFKSFGATTLQGRHVIVKSGQTSLRFITGKNKGREVEFPISDKATAKMLQERAKTAGKNGALFDTDAQLLRDYSKSKDGGGFKTKDHRTALGTETAIREIANKPPPRTTKEYKASVKEVATVVSKALGNTPSVALKSYIDPTVFSSWRIVE